MLLLGTIHFFSKLTSPLVVPLLNPISFVCVTGFRSAPAPAPASLADPLNADEGKCGVTRSTDLIPAEVQYFGSSRGSSGRVTNSYGVPATDSSDDVLVAGVWEREGVVVMAAEASVARVCSVGRRIVAGEQ